MYLGVDGGGTKTAALLADAHGKVLGWGLGGPANYHIVGIEGAFASVKAATVPALQGRMPDAACFSMAAADMPHDFAVLRAKLGTLNPDSPFVVHNDVISIFRAGSQFPYGVGVVCGTGFNAGGISKTGVEWRLPALGAITGDRAGAGDLAIHAFGAAFRAWDGRGAPTLLCDAILQALEVPDFETVAELWVQGHLPSGRVNSFAPLVFEVAEAGDAVAQGLIREQGVELGTAANAILRRLELTGVVCDVVLGGSMAYGKGTLLIDTVNAVVHQVAPNAVVKRLEIPPVAGAVMLAAEHVGVKVDAMFTANLRATLPDALRVPVVE